MHLTFSSILAKDHRGELEELMFFHPQQERFASSIVNTIETYGSPRVVEKEGQLRIALQGVTEVQTVYAVMEGLLQRELVGVVVFTRTNNNNLEVLFIVVKDEYTQTGSKSGRQVTLLLIQELCRIARQIRGIHSVQIGYRRVKTYLKVDLLRSLTTDPAQE